MHNRPQPKSHVAWIDPWKFSGDSNSHLRVVLYVPICSLELLASQRLLANRDCSRSHQNATQKCHRQQQRVPRLRDWLYVAAAETRASEIASAAPAIERLATARNGIRVHGDSAGLREGPAAQNLGGCGESHAIQRQNIPGESGARSERCRTAHLEKYSIIDPAVNHLNVGTAL